MEQPKDYTGLKLQQLVITEPEPEDDEGAEDQTEEEIAAAAAEATVPVWGSAKVAPSEEAPVPVAAPVVQPAPGAMTSVYISPALRNMVRWAIAYGPGIGLGRQSIGGGGGYW